MEPEIFRVLGRVGSQAEQGRRWEVDQVNCNEQHTNLFNKFTWSSRFGAKERNNLPTIGHDRSQGEYHNAPLDSVNDDQVDDTDDQDDDTDESD